MALAAYIVTGVVIPLIISKVSGSDGMDFRTKSENSAASYLTA